MDKDEVIQQGEVLRDAVADALMRHEADLGISMSVLMSMLISTALDMAEIEPTRLVAMFADGVYRYEEMHKAQEESENQEWLN